MRMTRVGNHKMFVSLTLTSIIVIFKLQIWSQFYLHHVSDVIMFEISFLLLVGLFYNK